MVGANPVSLGGCTVAPNAQQVELDPAVTGMFTMAYIKYTKQ